MRGLKCFLTVAILLVVYGCTVETLSGYDEEGEVQTITVKGPAPINFKAIAGNIQTKGTSVRDDEALVFNWAIGDTLGIFPNKGNQVEFPISAKSGDTSASFDGGGWALRNNASYAAYYPFSVWNYHRNNETILLDYSGQVQNGNGGFAHLSAYDYLASGKTSPENSAVTFQMERQGAILYIDIVVPAPSTITSLEISCDEAIFVEKASLDISGDEPVVKPVETKESLTLSFKNTETTVSNETVRAYMAVQPVDFSDKTVTATLYTSNGSYSAQVVSREVKKGSAAFLRFAGDFTPTVIEFADAEVKRLCVENWDTDGDGELSYQEAAAVRNLGKVFRENDTITTFNELEYLTGLTSIGSYAFYRCSSLTSIVIPEGVTSIGSYAFDGCSSLTSIVIPEGVTSIGTGAFGYCSSLTSIVISEGVTSIGELAFYFCSSLTSIVIPEGVTSIGTGAFAYCSRLSVFYGELASVDGRCLIVDGCLMAFAPYDVASYTIPEGVTSIGSYAFYGCSSLTSIVIPEGVTSIGYYAFAYCRSLTSIVIPEGVTSIGVGAFEACSRLSVFYGKFASVDGRCLIVDGCLTAFAPYDVASYTIPEGVTSIESYAFASCSSLTSIVIPEGVTSIGELAFSGCSSLTSIVIPDSVTSIGYATFYACSSLTSIVIPEGVTSIGGKAFEYCTTLSKIECKSQTPPTAGKDMFKETNNFPIYVPNESVEAYKAAPGWSDYADRIFGIVE